MSRIEKIDLSNQLCSLKKRLIYNFILKNPGIHFTEMSRQISIPKTTLLYYLRLLEKNELICKTTIGNYSRFYANNKFGKKAKKIYALFRQERPRNILLVILSSIGASQVEICSELDLPRTTVQYHLKKLLKFDIIEVAPFSDGKILRKEEGKIILRLPIKNEVIYRLKDPQLIFDMFITHAVDMEEGETKEVIKELDYLISQGVPNKIISSKKRFDNLIDTIYEIFPHPIHL